MKRDGGDLTDGLPTQEERISMSQSCSKIVLEDREERQDIAAMWQMETPTWQCTRVFFTV